MPGAFATLVWSTTPAHAAALKALGPADFAAMVNAAFRLSHVDIAYMAANFTSGLVDEVAWRESASTFDAARIPARAVGVQEKSVASFPLKMRHADAYIAERVALIGYVTHPPPRFRLLTCTGMRHTRSTRSPGRALTRGSATCGR